jgi:nanoRNase/pAp phosphatase (c-di-AMP/oligoRNAs hydrolase)
MKSKNEILNLFEKLSGLTGNIFIQTHNFPDHDAIASAYGLQKLLERFNIYTTICYDGSIERETLKEMIHDLSIKAYHVSEINVNENDYIIIVDGCKHNKNVTDLIGKEIAIIDHHEVGNPDDVVYNDIRSEYGSTSTIIYEYYLKTHQTLNKNIATAMMIGLNKDTASLTRGVTYHDVIAYGDLWHHSDMHYVNRVMRNDILLSDLNYFKKAIESLCHYKNFGFVFFEEECAQNLLGIIGDFLLAVKEFDFVVIGARNNARVNISARSEVKHWNSARIIEQALHGIGFGGGHEDMAGGIVTENTLIPAVDIFNRFKELLFAPDKV